MARAMNVVEFPHTYPPASVYRVKRVRKLHSGVALTTLVVLLLSAWFGLFKLVMFVAHHAHHFAK